MKIIYSLYCLLGIMLYQGEAQAYSLDNSLDLSDKQISNESTSYQKMAAVNFISRKSSKTSDVSEGDDLDNAPIKETECPEGYDLVNGVCMNVKACKEAFPLSSASNKVGFYVTKDCGGTKRYCYTSCATGYTRDGCECKAVDCSGFPFSESNGHHCNGIKSCKSGDTFKYKCTACETGYELSGTVCNNKACASGYYSSITSNCAKVETAKTGESLCYKCTECKQGWTLNTKDYTCTENSCGTGYTTSMISNCVSYESVTKTGANICYKCKACADGYSLNTTGTACEANSCQTGFSKTRSLYQCTSASAHMAGTDICKKCNSCSEYHGLNDSNECYDCTWSNYSHMDACPTGCSCTASEACGGHTKYRVDSANNYYKREDANDPAKGCVLCTEADDWGTGFVHETDCPANCTCEYSTACGVTKRKTPSYANAWYKFVNADDHEQGCTACEQSDWGDGFVHNYTCPTGCNCTPSTACSVIKYRVDSAQNYYKRVDASDPEKGCVQCTNKDDWSGYSSESCPSNCTCNSKYACGVTKYSSPTGAVNWYELNTSDNTCTACPQERWGTGFIHASCPTGCNCSDSTACGVTRKKVDSAQNYYKTNNEGTCTQCTDKDDWDGYSSESCPSNCTCNSKYACGVTKYSAPSSAKEGYTLSNGACSATDCSAYPHSGTSNCSSYGSCNSAGTVTYSCTGCNDGYTLSNGACSATDCSAYPASNHDNCKTYGSCNSAGTVTYACSICNIGYSLNDSGGCTANSCPSHPLTDFGGCKTYDTCYEGGTAKYACTSCNDGYQVNNGACTANNCSDYTQSNTDNCSSYNSCNSAGTVTYTCTACNDGYTLSNGACSATDCSAYPNANHDNCKTYTSCNSAGTTTYKCSACNDGYELKNNACVAKSCPTHYSTNSSNCDHCQSASACLTAKAGADTCYFCASCTDGYGQNGSGGCKQIIAKCSDLGAGWGTTNPSNCLTKETASSNEGTCYKCTACNTGYKLLSSVSAGVGNQCTLKKPSGPSLPENNCTQICHDGKVYDSANDGSTCFGGVSTKKINGTFYYRCSSCDYGKRLDQAGYCRKSEQDRVCVMCGDFLSPVD